MNQTDESEQQLKIWKNLAISKQMIMNEAASSLKLKSEWTQEELKDALDIAIKKGNEADDFVSKSKTEADKAVSDMQEEVRKANKAREEALANVDTAKAAAAQAEQQLANGRKDNADAVKKFKQQVIDKDKELKAINTALADTPENVVKKLKNLKKQKHDEAQARSKAEETNRKLKKETKELQEKVEEGSKLSEQGALLLAAYRDLQELCETQQKAMKEAKLETNDIPDLDPALHAAFSVEEEEKELATA